MNQKLPLRLAGILFLLASPILSFCCDQFGPLQPLQQTGNCSPSFSFTYQECQTGAVYYIQYSTDDGANWYIVGSIPANFSPSYTYQDNYAHPNNSGSATVYYRVIYYIASSGFTRYSGVCAINLGAGTCTNNNVTRCNGLPVLSINGPNGVCIGSGSNTYTISSNALYPVTWSISYNASYVTMTTTVTSAGITNSTNASGGYFTLVANEEGCDAISSNIYLNIPPAPTLISPANGTSLKPNIIYDITSPNANTWTVTNGTITGGQGTTDVQIKVANMVGSNMTVTGAITDVCGVSPHLIYQYPISNSGGGGNSISPDAMVGSNTEFGLANKPGVYPNPATNTVQVTMISTDYTRSYIKMFDLNGRLLKTIIPTNQTTQIDMTQHSSGIYILEIFDGKHHTIQKVVRL